MRHTRAWTRERSTSGHRRHSAEPDAPAFDYLIADLGRRAVGDDGRLGHRVDRAVPGHELGLTRSLKSLADRLTGSPQAALGLSAARSVAACLQPASEHGSTEAGSAVRQRGMWNQVGVAPTSYGTARHHEVLGDLVDRHQVGQLDRRGLHTPTQSGESRGRDS